ncbi:MAG: hypothetical protein C5B55_00810, partial [Blastocatellia bacterium]
MNITVLYVGSSLLAPLKNAEREINRAYKLNLRVAAYNFGGPLTESQWQDVEQDLSKSNLVFVIHVIEAENGARLINVLERFRSVHKAVVVINCMPDLMRRTRMGSLDVASLAGDRSNKRKSKTVTTLTAAGSWMGRQARGHREQKKANNHSHYTKLIDRLPGILKFIPTAGALTDAKHYLNLFCYFLQPTPANVQSMLLYALKHYSGDKQLQTIKVRIPQPEKMPSVAIYHPDSPNLFESFAAYRQWYRGSLETDETIGLLLMRPQVISKTTKHYDALIHAIEAEGMSVIPALATLMDNREAVSRFFIEPTIKNQKSKIKNRVSQIVSLTGFSFVGGPAMNDSEAAAKFLT